MSHRAIRLIGDAGNDLVVEYFLTQFASAEGKNGGQFYTPRCLVRVLVKMLAPYKGRVNDPCCGSAGMFVQIEKFVEEHGGRRRLATTSCCYTGTFENPAGWRIRNSPHSTDPVPTFYPFDLSPSQPVRHEP